MEAEDRGKERWGSLRVAGLCIGADDYKHTTPLRNAVLDAETFSNKLMTMSGCLSAVIRNPSDLGTLVKTIRRFLQDAQMRADPPEVIVIYYAGHVIQQGQRAYLVPINATLEDLDDLDFECLSLDRLMQMLRRDFDEHMQKKEVRAPTFLVALDSSRVELSRAGMKDDIACEPNEDAAPRLYTILLSCSRTTTATNDPREGHSPCAKALLDPKRGLFAEGVSVRDAIAHMSASLQESHGQTPISMGPPNCIPPGLCLLPASLREATAPAASGAEVGEQVAATHAPVEADVLDKLLEFGIEDAAAALAKHGFKKLRTLNRMEDRYVFCRVCSCIIIPCMSPNSR